MRQQLSSIFGIKRKEISKYLGNELKFFKFSHLKIIIKLLSHLEYSGKNYKLFLKLMNIFKVVMLKMRSGKKLFYDFET